MGSGCNLGEPQRPVKQVGHHSDWFHSHEVPGGGVKFIEKGCGMVDGGCQELESW